MKFLASPTAVKLRSVARSLGLTRLLAGALDRRARAARRARLRYQRERPDEARVTLGGEEIRLRVATEDEYVQACSFRYEAPLVEALGRHLAEGDCYWDIGANVGAYSCALGKFLEQRSGGVVAFEPDPWCHSRLDENLALNQLTRATSHRMALADREDVMGFAQDPASATTTGHLVSDGRGAAGRDVIEVQVTSGDKLLEQGRVPAPNVLKIDTEGYECEVLDGLRDTLASPECRFVLVEVHFSVLNERGLKDAPRRIELALREAGFSRLEWLDLSHLAASKVAL
ncbi:MAG: FkbM family methyltransferase [Acidobacteriota bacterium]